MLPGLWGDERASIAVIIRPAWRNEIGVDREI